MFKVEKELFLGNSIYSLDFNDNSIAIGGEYFFKVWDFNTSKFDIELITNYSTTVSCSPNNKYITFNNSNDSVYIINLETNEKKLFKGFGILSTIFSQDSKFIASTNSEDKDFLKVYDLTLGTIKELELYWINDLSYSTNNKVIACSNDRCLYLIDSEKNEIIQIEQDYYFVSCVEYSPDGKNLASVVVGDVDGTDRGKAGGIDIYDVIDNRIVFKFRFKNSVGVFNISYSSDSKYIVSSDYNSSSVRIWDSNSGDLVKVLSEDTNKITCVKWSRNGKYIATGSSNGLVRIWGVEL